MVYCQISNSHTLQCPRENSDSDRTPHFIEPQICAGGFSDEFRWRLDAKIVDKHKAWHTAALAPPLRILQCRQMAPIQLDSIMMLVKKLTPDRYPDRYREGEILDWLLLLFCVKRSVVCDRLRFCVHHLVVYQDYFPRPSMRGPYDANPLLTAPK